MECNMSHRIKMAISILHQFHQEDISNLLRVSRICHAMNDGDSGLTSFDVVGVTVS